MNAATMEAIHCPVPPPLPRPTSLSRNPPTTAPAMPMMIVTTIPPGSSPGMTHLASTPAISPTMIQKIIAPSIFASLLFVDGPRLLGVVVPITSCAQTTCSSHYVQQPLRAAATTCSSQRYEDSTLGHTLKLHWLGTSGRAVMEFGLRELLALASSGAVGALIAFGYQKWIKR